VVPEPDWTAIDICTCSRAADPVASAHRARTPRAASDLLRAGPASEGSTVSASHDASCVSPLVSTRLDGTARPSRLREADLEARFPAC